MAQTPPFLMIGTPCSGGLLSTVYAYSLLQLQQACAHRHVDLGYLMQSGDALITRARQTILTHFLAETKGTVAVGMPVAQHPPHRSPQAVLPHEALILDE